MNNFDPNNPNGQYPPMPNMVPTANVPVGPVAPVVPNNMQSSVPMGVPPSMPGNMLAPVGMGQVPSYHMPDAESVKAAYQQAKEEAASWGMGDGPVFVKFYGPNGQDKWDVNSGVLPGYTAEVLVYILPPWAQGRGIFLKMLSHFWRSYQYPKGRGINCPGGEQCLICQGKQTAMETNDPLLQKKAKSFGRVQKQYFYNVVVLNNPQGHINAQGVMRPLVLRAGHYLHRSIGDLMDVRGVANIVDPMKGRPVLLRKTKTGPDQMDVEYSAVDMDPQPLPATFYPALQNLWNMDDLNKAPSQEEMSKAVLDMQLPLAGNTGMVQAPPDPPYENPYAVQQNPRMQGAPGYMNQAPNVIPTPVPVQSVEVNNSTSYQPQPSQLAAGGPPPISGQQVVPPAPTNFVSSLPAPAGQDINNQMTPCQLSLPLPAGFTLPGGRERCFGKYNATHQYCTACTQWIQSQCAALSGSNLTTQSPAQGGSPNQQQTLEQLQKQISGQ